MTPAQRHRLLTEARRAEAAVRPPLDAAAAKTAAQAAEAQALAASIRPRAANTPAYLKRLARQGAASVVANDNQAADDQPSARAPSPDAVIRLRLAGDKRTLKAVKSQAAKAELKKTLLPSYDAWIAGVMAGVLAKRTQEPGFKGAQDDILINAIIWRLDVGDLAEAVRLYAFAASNDWKLPEPFKRDLHTFVVEQAAEVANAELKAGHGLSDTALGALLDVEKLVREIDLHDEVRAELYKAVGLELFRRSEAEGVSPPIRRAQLEAAGLNLNEARRLNPRSGVTKAIEKLERAFKALPPPEEAPPPATDAALLTELVIDGYRAELVPIEGGHVLIAFPAFPGFTTGAPSQDLAVIVAEAGKALTQLIADRLAGGEEVPPPDAPAEDADPDAHEEQH